MRIGIPKEKTLEEKRVALAPAGVLELIKAGHTVYIETGAGVESRFSDEEYSKLGANIVYSREEVFQRSEMIVKIAPLTEEESELLEERQILFSFLHLALSKSKVVENLLKKKITAIGYELISENGNYPVLNSMGEIAGQMAVQIAERYLESSNPKSRGVLIGGVAGVAPAAVVILGAGVVGFNAARAALGRGAQVIILDKDIKKLRYIEDIFDKKITTVIANDYTIARGVKFADILIGAVSIGKDVKAPHIVTEDMVKTMKEGAVVVDVSIDQGGCVQTSRPTTISNPIYIQHNVIHFCVPNIPAMVARTASYALTNATIKYISMIADLGLEKALLDNIDLSKGVCSYNGYISNEAIASIFNCEYKRLHIFSNN
jgi:alanine dehydrogenase